MEEQPKWPSTDEWIKISCLYTMEYCSAIRKEWNNAICSNVDGLTEYHIKWTKSDRRQTPYDIIYMWNPKKWHKWIYTQNRKRPQTQKTNLWFSSVQSLSRVRLFVTPRTAARQASLSITISQSSPKSMSLESVMPSNYLFLCHPFSSCPQSLSASGSFPMSGLFASGVQTIGGASASVLPMNIQDWFPLGLTRLISLQSKGLSNTTVQKHQFFDTQLSL